MFYRTDTAVALPLYLVSHCIYLRLTSTNLPPQQAVLALIEGQTTSIVRRAFLPAPVALVACRSEFVTTDSAGRIGVFPLDGSSIGGVGVDVAAELASQVGTEVKMPRAMTSRSILANQSSTWLSQDE